MKKVAVFISEKTIASSVTGILDLFDEINSYLRRTGKGPDFKIELVSQQAGPVRVKRVVFDCEQTIKNVGDIDLILIPPMESSSLADIGQYSDVSSWIKDAYLRGNTEVASLCTGAFLLGASGILNGKTCSTHWAAADGFQQMFTQVNLASHRIITDEDGVYTSGGASSFYNLLLYIIEKYCGREVAIRGAKMMLVEFDKTSQQHFSIFQPQKNHEDEQIVAAQQFIEQNYDQEIALEDMASYVGLSKRSFIRRFKKATDNTPIQYLQRVRIEAAKKSLETTAHTVSEVMYNTGYSDMKSFRQLFKNLTGLTPVAYRKKYQFVVG